MTRVSTSPTAKFFASGQPQRSPLPVDISEQRIVIPGYAVFFQCDDESSSSTTGMTSPAYVSPSSPVLLSVKVL